MPALGRRSRRGATCSAAARRADSASLLAPRRSVHRRARRQPRAARGGPRRAWRLRIRASSPPLDLAARLPRGGEAQRFLIHLDRRARRPSRFDRFGRALRGAHLQLLQAGSSSTPSSPARRPRDVIRVARMLASGEKCTLGSLASSLQDLLPVAVWLSAVSLLRRVHEPGGDTSCASGRTCRPRRRSPLFLARESRR